MKKNLLLILVLAAVICCAAVPASAQLTTEERDIIITEILKRLDLDNVVDIVLNEKLPGIQGNLQQQISTEVGSLKSDISREVQQNIQSELGSIIAAEVAKQLQANPQTAPQPAAQPTEEPQQIQNPAPAPAAQPQNKTYNGPHVKFVNSYAYQVGGDEKGAHTYKSEYYPNELFTVDIVFENDGNMALPTNLELRHTGNSGEYTGHTESAYAYGKNIQPGQRVGFSFAAHGSENIGNISWSFQLFDADTGNAVNGGYGSFFYVARP